MQKIINGIAILSGVISLTVVGSGVFIYLQKDAIIENVKGKVMDAVMPSLVGSEMCIRDRDRLIHNYPLL